MLESVDLLEFYHLILDMNSIILRQNMPHAKDCSHINEPAESEKESAACILISQGQTPDDAYRECIDDMSRTFKDKCPICKARWTQQLGYESELPMKIIFQTQVQIMEKKRNFDPFEEFIVNGYVFKLGTVICWDKAHITCHMIDDENIIIYDDLPNAYHGYR